VSLRSCEHGLKNRTVPFFYLLYIEPGSPWENGYVESYIGKLRDELLNGEILDTLMEAKVLVEGWRKEYNRFRPHSSLGYKPPAPEAYEVENFTQGLVH
jgi:transposase InsO family protein